MLAVELIAALVVVRGGRLRSEGIQADILQPLRIGDNGNGCGLFVKLKSNCV